MKTTNNTSIYRLLFEEAKRQFYNKEISLQEYNEAMCMIFEKITELENYVNRREYIENLFKRQASKISIKDTINYALAMN